ncbi:hypothetical protein LINGRAHAP2_LOCUS8874 [Linum grandiflorum]
MNDDLMQKRMAYLASLNLGSCMKFCPTTKELFVDFLIPKLARGDALDDEDPIQEFDAYSLEPWDLWNKFAADDTVFLHLYTTLKRKSPSTVQRGIAGGKGRWHGETVAEKQPVEVWRTETNAKTKKQRMRMYKRTFEIRNFSYKNPGHPENRRWLMDEYKEKDSTSDLVIFRLRKNSGKARDRDDLATDTASSSTSPATGNSTCTDDSDERDPKRLQYQESDMWINLGDIGDLPNYLGF